LAGEGLELHEQIFTEAVEDPDEIFASADFDGLLGLAYKAISVQVRYRYLMDGNVSIYNSNVLEGRSLSYALDIKVAEERKKKEQFHFHRMFNRCFTVFTNKA